MIHFLNTKMFLETIEKLDFKGFKFYYLKIKIN